MSEHKVIAHVSCGSVTLKLTLNAKILAKSLKDGCITPFLGAYNKKYPDAEPLTADALCRLVQPPMRPRWDRRRLQLDPPRPLNDGKFHESLSSQVFGRLAREGVQRPLLDGDHSRNRLLFKCGKSSTTSTPRRSEMHARRIG